MIAKWRGRRVSGDHTGRMLSKGHLGILGIHERHNTNGQPTRPSADSKRGKGLRTARGPPQPSRGNLPNKEQSPSRSRRKRCQFRHTYSSFQLTEWAEIRPISSLGSFGADRLARYEASMPPSRNGGRIALLKKTELGGADCVGQTPHWLSEYRSIAIRPRWRRCKDNCWSDGMNRGKATGRERGRRAVSPSVR